MINTSYFDNVKNLPDTVCPISIAGKASESYHGIEYKKLAPKLSFWKIWEQTHDNDYYVEQFYKTVLDLLDPQQVYNELYKLSNGKIPCLICYEKPGEFCHRHIVANWLSENLNIEIYEIPDNLETRSVR